MNRLKCTHVHPDSVPGGCPLVRSASQDELADGVPLRRADIHLSTVRTAEPVVEVDDRDRSGSHPRLQSIAP